MTGLTTGHGSLTLRPYHPAWWLTRLIRAYSRYVSPLLGKNCRYHPTCSSYSMEAISRYGSVRGGWMAAKRIGRCHPFREGGIDPVPELDAEGRR